MKMTAISEGIKLLFARCIIANELGNSITLAYRFSDPDGVRSGKSGWSFGVCQYDINNNPNAEKVLKECGFSRAEIDALRAQTIDVEPLNIRLVEHKDVISKWDARQLQECLVRSLTNCMALNTDFSSEEVILHLADYDNQFYFAHDGKLYTWLKYIVNWPLTPELFLNWKLKNTAWGKDHKEDVERRYDNIRKIYAERA